MQIKNPSTCTIEFSIHRSNSKSGFLLIYKTKNNINKYRKKNANGFAKNNYVPKTQNNNGKTIMGMMHSTKSTRKATSTTPSIMFPS